MKKNILLVVSFLLVLNQGNACDVCGGAVNNTGGDGIPGIFSNYLGLNSSFRSFTSTHLTLFESEIPMKSQEQFMSYGINGRYSPIRRLQFLVNVPVSVVQKQLDEDKRVTSGLSDVTMRVNYLLFDRQNDSTKTFFNLFLGSSIKAPTGRSSFRENEDYFFHRNMLPGSGTLDFGIHMNLLLRKKDNGCTIDGSAMIRGTASNSYNFGNLYSGRISGFRFVNIKKSKLMVDLGMEFTVNSQDRYLISNSSDKYTGGWMLSPSFRMNYFLKDLIFSITAQRPISQNLADGQVVNNIALKGSVIYLLKRNKK